MNIKDNLSKISWSFLDKLTLVIYGLVALLQIKYMEPEDYGYFFSLQQLTNFFLSNSDSLALQGIIQFGQRKEDRKKVNALAMLINFFVLSAIPILILILKPLYIHKIANPYFAQLIYVLPIITTLSAVRIYVLKILSRDLRFKDTYWMNFIFYAILTIATAYGILVEKKLNANFMIVAYIVANFLSGIYAFMIARSNFVFSLKGGIRLKEYLKFTIPVTLVSVFHSVPKLLDVFIISVFLYNPNKVAIIGVYASAKTLFRIFDQALDASYSLIYPAAVKSLASGNKEVTQKLFSKAVSFILVIFLVLFVILQLGFTEYLISYLPYKYHSATQFFNLMIYSVLFLPFTLLAIIINAEGKPNITFYFVLLSAVLSTLTFAYTARIGRVDLLPLGIIVYNVVLATCSYVYTKLNYGFPIKMVFRSIFDTKNFIFSTLNKRKGL